MPPASKYEYKVSISRHFMVHWYSCRLLRKLGRTISNVVWYQFYLESIILSNISCRFADLLFPKLDVKHFFIRILCINIQRTGSRAITWTLNLTSGMRHHYFNRLFILVLFVIWSLFFTLTFVCSIKFPPSYFYFKVTVKMYNGKWKKLRLMPVHQNGLNYSEYLKKEYTNALGFHGSVNWICDLEDMSLSTELLFPNGQKGVCGTRYILVVPDVWFVESLFTLPDSADMCQDLILLGMRHVSPKFWNYALKMINHTLVYQCQTQCYIAFKLCAHVYLWRIFFPWVFPFCREILTQGTTHFLHFFLIVNIFLH